MKLYIMIVYTVKKNYILHNDSLDILMNIYLNLMTAGIIKMYVYLRQRCIR